MFVVAINPLFTCEILCLYYLSWLYVLSPGFMSLYVLSPRLEGHNKVYTIQKHFTFFFYTEAK